MLEVLVLLEHWSFVNVIVSRNAMLACVLGQLTNILSIVATDIHVEEHHVTVHILLSQQMFEMLAYRHNRLWQTRLFIPGIDCEIKHCNACISQTVGNLGA